MIKTSQISLYGGWIAREIPTLAFKQPVVMI